jgi:hypothetical protein
MAEKNKTIRETDEEARQLARQLISRARYGSLAVLLPDGGHPFASRTAVACDTDRTPVILVSQLSAHTAGLANDPRVSLLLGEPGKGDPLAHPRITLQCSAVRIDREDERHAIIRARFLRRHPKSALYADFPDFCFFRLEPQSASLNGGFGKAYSLTPDDFLIASPAIAALADIEESAIAHMNDDHAEAVALYALVLAGEKDGKWKICGIDAAGIDLAATDRLQRLEFDAPLQDADGLRTEMATLAKRAREKQPK